MESRLTAIIPAKVSFRAWPLFAYSTKGMPGLEIVGLGKNGRFFKEKLIYLSRFYRLRIPHRRYVLCVESSDTCSPQYAYLELPLAILFWHLAGIVPMRKLEDCCCGGMIGLDGRITHLDYSDLKLNQFIDQFLDGQKIISSGASALSFNQSHLPIEEILHYLSPENKTLGDQA